MTGPAELHPGAVRVLAVLWSVFAAFLAQDLVRRGEPDELLLGLPLLALSVCAARALFWQPAVRVSDEHVELVNVWRTVRLPWSSVQDLDTRWAFTVLADDRRWTAWAAPSSGRRVRPVRRRETPWVQPGDEWIEGSRAPGSTAGEAALLVGVRWEVWRQRPAPQRTGTGAGVQVRWNTGTAASLVLSAALVVLAAAVAGLR